MTRIDRKPLLTVVLAVVPLVLAACASFPDEQQDPVQLRLTDVESRLIRIERLMENEALLELAARLDQIQRNSQELTGEIEQLRFELQQAQDRQRQQYLDLDGRLGELEQRAGQGGLPAGPGAAALGPGGATGQVAVPDLLPVPQGNDEANYEAAFAMLARGEYRGAGDAFRAFLGVFPDSPFAANAQYWLAESAYVQRDFGEALQQFQRVIESYPQSDKVPDALLKIGYSNYELQRWDAARDALQVVRTQYTGTTAASLATQRLDRMRNEGR